MNVISKTTARPRQTKSAGRILSCLVLFFGPALTFLGASCAPEGDDDVASGESHFGSKKALFRSCEDGVCESGDSCACAVCTVPCNEIADCAERILGDGGSVSDLPDSVVCAAPACTDVPVSDDEANEIEGSVCEVLCNEDADCEFLSAAHECRSGHCRTSADPEDPSDAPVLGAACPAGRRIVPGEYLTSGTGVCLDETEVTVAAFEGCVDSGDCTAPALGNYLTAGRELHPVHFVTLSDAETFCAFAGGRLPTEEEWMAAANGDDRSRLYPFAGAPPTVDDAPARVCAFDGATCDVGSHPAGDGPLAHADLSGNVAELVISDSADCVLGGSFASDASALEIGSCGVSDAPSETVGFRCVSDP